MIRMRLSSLAAAALAAVPALAQDAEPAPRTGIWLEVTSPVVSEGQPIDLTLRAVFDEPTTVPATLLGGVDLQSWFAGEASKAVSEPLDGEVAIAGGTSIHRRIRVESAGWSPGQLVFAWKGELDSKVTVQIVPDQTEIDVEALDLSKTTVRLITNYGEMVVSFFPEAAPGHVKNFIKLAKEGFYNGTRFHRVIRDFMIQGGDPNTKPGATGPVGAGSPGYRIDAEFSDNKHVRGILSMARASDPNSAGSQCFIMHGTQSGLDGKYSVFGKLESGLETLDAIANVPVRPTPSNEPSMPVEPVHLYAAVVVPVPE